MKKSAIANYRCQVKLVSLTTHPLGNEVSSPAENRPEDFGRKSIYGPSHVRVVNLTDHEAGSELLEACRGGDRLAFRQLYDLYKNRVYSIALYFFHGDRIAASDVTQQVFLKLLANIGQFRGEAVFSTCFTGWSSTPASMKHAAAIRVLPSTSGRDSRQLRERIQAGI